MLNIFLNLGINAQLSLCHGLFFRRPSVQIFSKTTGPMKLKLGMYVPTNDDTGFYSNHLDPILNMAAMVPILKNKYGRYIQPFVQIILCNLVYIYRLLVVYIFNFDLLS